MDSDTINAIAKEMFYIAGVKYHQNAAYRIRIARAMNDMEMVKAIEEAVKKLDEKYRKDKE